MRTHPTRKKLQRQSRIYTHRLLYFNYVSLDERSKTNLQSIEINEEL
jgi:hypothetical protein